MMTARGCLLGDMDVKGENWLDRAARYVIMSAVFAMGCAMFIAAAKTKLLPASYLAALCGLLLIPAILIAFLLRRGRRARFWLGAVLAAAYIVLAASGYSMASRTERALRSIVVTEQGEKIADTETNP